MADESHLQPSREPGQETSAPSLQTPANTQHAQRPGTDLEQWLVTFAAASKQHTPAAANRTLFQTILPTPALPKSSLLHRVWSLHPVPQEGQTEDPGGLEKWLLCTGPMSLVPREQTPRGGRCCFLLHLQPLLTASDAVSS